MNGSSFSVNGMSKNDKNNTLALVCKFVVRVCFVVCLIAPQFGRAALPISFGKYEAIYQCNESVIPSSRANFSNCIKTQGEYPNPQNKQLWLIYEVNLRSILQDIDPPYGLFVYAKAASRIYIDGIKIGENGNPSSDAALEIVGKMDAEFYLPLGSLADDKNFIAIELSSHHGLVNLVKPIHFIGVGHYREANKFVQENSQFGLVLLGVFLISFLYFSTLAFNPRQRQNAIFLSLLCFFASCQLFIELLRGLYQYDYPVHDIRLFAVTLLSFCFGITLLAFISFKFAERFRWHWIYGGIIITLIALWVIPGFDAKTTLSTFVPVVVAFLLMLKQSIEQRTIKHWQYLVAFALLLLTVILTISVFHEFIYFLIICVFLCYLFVQQARDIAKEQLKRQEEEKQIAKLELMLAQFDQVSKPKTIKVNSAGKIIVLSSVDIVYCQASGDYVDIQLLNGTRHLFSGSLKSLEELLPSTFIRVHRSYLVNLPFVNQLETRNTGGELSLNGGFVVPVSRRMVPSVRQVISNA